MADTIATQSVLIVRPIPIVNEQDEVFNYELVQLRYLEACEEHFKMPNTITAPWTQKVRSLVISSIRTNRKTISWMDSIIDLGLEKYQIVLDEEAEKLVLTGTAIEVLPYEECFDIFVEVHRNTGHGAFEEIKEKLENTFLVNYTCLHFFLSYCNVCKKCKLQNMTPVVFNDCVTIEILKAPIPDMGFRFILFYIDHVTKYMLFRPLIAMDEYEIAIEMLKIFTDFGPPAVVKTMHVALLYNVLTVLERGGFQYDISIYASDKVISESYYMMQFILSRTNKDNNFWSTICRFIQFKRNAGQLLLREPLVAGTNAVPKPYNHVFLKKVQKDSVTETQEISQNTTNNSSNNTVTLFNVENIIQEFEINSDSSETETASEAGELSAMAMETEEISLSNNDLTITQTDDSAQMDDRHIDNRSIDNEIKIENNPLETDSNSETFLQNVWLPKVEEEDKDESVTGTSTGDSNPLTQDPLEDCLSLVGSVSEPVKLPTIKPFTQHKFSVAILRKDRQTQEMKGKTDSDYCCMCNGKMFSDFFCFGCKKRTHIFCLTRVTSPLLSSTDTVKSFTYCNVCLKEKYSIKDSKLKQ